MITAYVYHNQNRLAMFRGLEIGDDLRLVYRMEDLANTPLNDHAFQDLEAVCQRVFDKLNSDIPEDYQYRSLSVGDVVTLVSSLDARYRVSFVVLPTGWLRLDGIVANGGKWGVS
jgi:hypothetical protein